MLKKVDILLLFLCFCLVLSFFIGQNQKNKILELEQNLSYYKIVNESLQQQVDELMKNIENVENSIESIFLQKSEAFGLDPKLIYFVIEHESRWRSDAIGYNTNGTKDFGLMQLNNGGTAQWLWGLLYPNEIYSEKELLNPEKNLEMGMYLLSYLTSKYDCLHQVLSSYNRGEGGMKKLQSPETSYSKNILEKYKGAH